MKRIDGQIKVYLNEPQEIEQGKEIKKMAIKVKTSLEREAGYDKEIENLEEAIQKLEIITNEDFLVAYA